ncbi:Type 4 pili biogenesis protein pilB (nuleotide-binding protein) [Limnohabitans planktonicus II-D5]|uniref:Type 4 pili biogenesis protein pilB (Nuleotide-binding protein) n=1 Tax=Limnohabitans planktonicus II-D5 TaxID=1293045 RepID=A0A2T7UEM1_9BURK|nr:Type 4 pili biogenesis protein pilB (nuleotide-binding protein) [Limnohabitans planktonicus II-D5]|eukprot:gene24997-31399_t
MLDSAINKAKIGAIEDAPVVNYVQQLLEQAVAMKASDLHFEPYEHHYRVRMRIDGELREMATPHLVLKDRLSSRIKVLSRLDIAEKRLPQDGRMKLHMPDGRELDLRVSTLPTLFGEKLVIRVLDSAQAQLDLNRLGYEPADLARLTQAIRHPHGMVLVTGPTGSGKTQSLYACLNLLNTAEVNIATVEDPCEIQLQGINQVNVQDKPGLSFAVALRAFLRQDPDILMVGEVRDLETANIAIQAAQTGHLVLSTLHTNDAPSTLVRLRNMGTASYNIAASVTLITAQRLVRCLCPHCKQSVQLPSSVLLQAGLPQDLLSSDSVTVYGPVGCDQCHKGFAGRTGIFQVMPVSAEMQNLVLRDAGSQELALQAQREGVSTLRQAGLRKVLQGVTSLEEVLAATRDGA